MLPGLQPASNFEPNDPVLNYLAPLFDTTLVIISHIYITKITNDIAAVGARRVGGLRWSSFQINISPPTGNHVNVLGPSFGGLVEVGKVRVED